MDKINILLAFLLSESVMLPFLAGVIRFRKISTAYYPFIALLLLGVITELASFVSIRLWKTNTIVANTYGLLECFIILYQFYCWDSLRKTTRWFYVLSTSALVVWLVNYIVLGHLNDYGLPIFRVLYPFMVVIISINEINFMITHDSSHLYKNARFVIYSAFIIFFLYQILYEGAYSDVIEGGQENELVSNKIISLFGYVNVFVNILYAVAVLLIPAKNSSRFERIFEKIGGNSE